MNTTARTNVRTTARTTARTGINTHTVDATASAERPHQAAAPHATRRTRGAAALASVLVSCGLLASVVGGFGAQADAAAPLAQQSPSGTAVVARA